LAATFEVSRQTPLLQAEVTQAWVTSFGRVMQDSPALKLGLLVQVPWPSQYCGLQKLPVGPLEPSVHEVVEGRKL